METGSFDSKKRKICHEHEDDDEDEEAKIEKFYAIVNTLREARDRFIINNNKKRKLEEEVKHVGVWKPSFQPQDFMQEADVDKTNQPAATSQTKQGEPGKDLKHEVKQGLDLTLSL